MNSVRMCKGLIERNAVLRILQIYLKQFAIRLKPAVTCQIADRKSIALCSIFISWSIDFPVAVKNEKPRSRGASVASVVRPMS